MALVVKEFFTNATFQVPSGVTGMFYQFIDDPDNTSKTVMAASTGNATTYYNRIDGTLVGCGQQTANNRGLADGTTTSRSTPTFVAYANNVYRPSIITSYAGGSLTTSYFILPSTGLANQPPVGWGQNTFGELGDGTILSKSTPVSINNPVPYYSIQGEANSVLALGKDGTIWGSGLNTSGQLGDGTVANRSTPTAATIGTTRFLSAQTFGAQSLGIDVGGNVWGWGVTPPSVPFNVNRSTPTLANGLPLARDIVGFGAENNALGGFQYVMLGLDNSVSTWGNGTNGSLGDGVAGATTTRMSPVQLTLPSGIGNAVKVRTTRRNAGYLTDQGTLVLWGDNSAGSVGDGTLTNRSTPTVVTGHRFVDFQLGTWTNTNQPHVLALKEDGTVWVWGREVATLAVTNRSTPTQISTPGSIYTSIINTSNANYAILNDGSMHGKGMNGNGELGNGSFVPVTTLQSLVQLNLTGDGNFADLRSIYGVDTIQATGLLEVRPNQTVNIQIGPRPAIQGIGIAFPQQIVTSTGLSRPYFFARMCRVWWVE